MFFNTDKCSVMYNGRNDADHEFELCGKRLEVTTDEKELGVIMHNSLKPSR